MNRLANRSERLKLANVLGVESTKLAFLDTVPASQLERMRFAFLEEAYLKDTETYQRLLSYTAWLPAMLIASIIRHTISPLFIARLASELPAKKTAAIAKHLPPYLVAQIACYLDPRRAPDLLRLLPTRFVVDIALELIQQQQYITMAQFADSLNDSTIRAVMEAIEDEAHLARIVFFMRSKNRLDHLVRLLPTERQQKLILLVLDDEQDIMTEILSLIFHVGYALKRELGELAAKQHENILNRIIRTTQAQQLWPELLTVIASLTSSTQRKVVNLALLKQEPEFMQSILQAAKQHQLWLTVLPLVEMLDEQMRELVAQFSAQLNPEAKQQVIEAALIGEHWSLLADIVERMPTEAQKEIGTYLMQYGAVDQPLLKRLSALADKHGFGDYLRLDTVS